MNTQRGIDFKTLILTYKAVHGLAPDYICDLVTLSTPSRSLRSADCLSLYQPRCKLKTWGGGLFLITGLSYGTHYLRSLGMLPPWIVLRNFSRHIFLVKLLIYDYLL